MKYIIFSILFSMTSFAQSNYCSDAAHKVIKDHFVKELGVSSNDIYLEVHDSWFDETYGKGEYYIDAIIQGTYFSVELHMVTFSDENDNPGKCEVQELIVD